MNKEDIEIDAALYEDACHNPSIQQHFIDGAEWVIKEWTNQQKEENYIVINGVKHVLVDDTKGDGCNSCSLNKECCDILDSASCLTNMFKSDIPNPIFKIQNNDE